MAYELITSRVIVDDRRVVFSDSPIVATSVMIEIAALDPNIRRLAGWIYPVILSAPGEYERQSGDVVLFGRSRIAIPEMPQDVFLEFFPQYGLRGLIVNVFSGFPGSIVPPPSDRWVRSPNAQFWYALTDSVLWESGDGQTRLRSIEVAVTEGYVDPPSGFVIYKVATGANFLYIQNRTPQVSTLDSGSYQGIANNGGLPL